MRTVSRTLSTLWAGGVLAVTVAVLYESEPSPATPAAPILEPLPAAARFVVDRRSEPAAVVAVIDAAPAVPEATVAAPTASRPAAWAPPSWFPAPDALLALGGMGGAATGDLKLSSRAAFVYDVDAGEVLVARGADEPRPVASLTKLMASLAMASTGADLDEELCVDEQFWPSWRSGRSKLLTGQCYHGWDLLGAALVASDNRAAFGLQVLSDLPYDQFLGRMDEVSRQLGMARSQWADPSGLEDDNMSTARDMTRAALAVSAHPDLSIAATAPFWRIERTDQRGKRTLFSTNRYAARKDLEILAAKTGYTDTARYCFSAVVRTAEGRTIAFTLLGANRGKDRWRDVERILRYVQD